MLYIIKQYKVLFMNSIINKFENNREVDVGRMTVEEFSTLLDRDNTLDNTNNGINDASIAINKIVEINLNNSELNNSELNNINLNLTNETNLDIKWLNHNINLNLNLNNSSEESPESIATKLRNLWLPNDVVENLAYNRVNHSTLKITDDTYGYPTIEVDWVPFIVNWEKTDAYNNYFNNSDDFGQASFPN